MMIGEAIVKASNEYEVYFLLTSYLETAQYCSRLNKLPGHVLEVPVTGMADVTLRLERLTLEYDRLSQSADHEQRVIIGEAVEIFTAAFNCLCSLDQAASQLPRTEGSAGFARSSLSRTGSAAAAA